MNLSISNANTISRKHLKVTYIAAATAVALAAAVVVSHVSLQNHSSVVAPTGVLAEANAPSPSFVYYIARSQQEAAELTSLLSSEGAAYAMSLNATVLVDQPDTRSMIATASGELMQAGARVRVVEPVASPDKTLLKNEATPTVDAAIMAGVISSERATWSFDDGEAAQIATAASARTRPMFATAADAEYAAKSLIALPEAQLGLTAR